MVGTEDIRIIFTNLIDNSIYWLSEKNVSERKITIQLIADGDSLDYIDYRDNGPGINRNHIESEVIFEPDFSTKPEGTGLGLAIAGETARRNSLRLKAIECDDGAHFTLEPGVCKVFRMNCRAIQLSVFIPMSLSACSGCAAKYRSASAISVYPEVRNKLITALRNAHITCGMLPHRTLETHLHPIAYPACDVKGSLSPNVHGVVPKVVRLRHTQALDL